MSFPIFYFATRHIQGRPLFPPATTPRNVLRADSRHYVIEKQTPKGWRGVSFALSTAEADRLIAQKTRFESGRFRAVRAA